MFNISSPLTTKLVFWRKNAKSTSIQSTVDMNQVAESDSPILPNATTLPLSSSKTRKLRLFSTLTHSKKTSLASVFNENDMIQTPSIVIPCATSATLEPSGHVPDVLEDGSLPTASSSREHWECDADFGLVSSTMNESLNREDSILDPDPPGSRTAVRVASLRMRTAAVWASIPSTMDGILASCEYSETSTPVKSWTERDETTSIDHGMMYSLSFSSPATSVTAVSECGLRNHFSPKLSIDHKQEWSRITPNVLSAAVLDPISLEHPPDFLGLVAESPPQRRRITEEQFKYNSSDIPASECGSFVDVLSSSSDERADQRAASPSDSFFTSPRIPHTLSRTAISPIAGNQLFVNSDEDLTSTRGSLSPFQGPLVAEVLLRPWSCAKITRAKTKRASRKELLDKRGFFTRVSRVF